MNSARIDAQNTTARTYTRSAVFVHWLLAAALLAQLALGWWILDLPKSPPGLRAGWFNLHKSIGLSIAAVVLLRIVWRRAHPTAPDASLPLWQQRASRATHALLYLCMLVMPLSGFLGSNFTGYPVLFFGIRLAGWNRDWPQAKEWMSTLHYATAWLLLAMLSVHVAAALWHWVRRDSVCGRMGIPPPPTLSRS